MEPVPDPDVTDPPPIVYERQLMDYKPTSGSLSTWARWVQKHLKEQVEATNRLLEVMTRAAERGSILKQRVDDLENSKASKEVLSRLLARVHEAEEHITSGIRAATEWQGRAATRIEKLEDVTKTTKHVVNQNAISRAAAHCNLKMRVDALDGAYAQLVARLHKLELNSPSPEPVAERTRARKQPRASSPP